MILLVFAFSYVSAVSANKDFIINNNQCRMPNFLTMSNEIAPIFYSLPYVNCTDLNILTYTTVENNTAFLHIREEYLDQYYLSNDSIDCCYSYVRRNGSEVLPDVGISFAECEFFNSTVTLQEDTVLVKCYLGADKIYTNVHTTVVVTESVDAKLKNLTENSNLLKKKPLSVLFLVIDGVARLNFERTMPLSKEFLIKNNFTEFLGYNKIDDNTFPNFNALLTGLNLKQSQIMCRPDIVGYLDKCPMIWYDFKNYGYATAYAEDWAILNTYNFMKKGFKDPPTDYYFKPYMEAVQSLKGTVVDTMPFCGGPETQGERIFNAATDFAVTFKNKPSFGIFWMNTFSHNYLNTPTRMDVKFLEFLNRLKEEGVLDDSMVVLLADHGVRFGEIRKTIQGWYEERLPMNFISLPPWFKEENPEKYQNLVANSHKLTSTYDLHMTLQEVLSMSVENYTVTQSQACSSCKSLFSEIPDPRSCLYAGIPEQWCTCIGKFVKNDTSLTPQLQKQALQYIINSRVLRSPNSSIDKILSSSITYHQRRAYVLIVFKSDYSAYQVLLRGAGRPLRFVKIVQVIILENYKQ